MTRLRRDTWWVHVSSACKAQKKHPQRGRPLARGTGAVAEGGGESEGCIRAKTSGNRDTLGPGRAKAARVGVSFPEGPMSNALTLHDMSPGLRKVVGRESPRATLAEEPDAGKSACPELARGRVGQPLGLLYKVFSTDCARLPVQALHHQELPTSHASAP